MADKKTTRAPAAKKGRPSSSGKRSSAAGNKREVDKRAIIAVACIVVAVAVCLGVVFGAILPDRKKDTTRPAVTEDGDNVYVWQSLSYSESTQFIDNPDQGFYRPIGVKLLPNASADSSITYNKNIVTDATRLYHLRIDISAFSGAVNGAGDLDITRGALDGLDGLLTYLRERQKNAVVRFAYDKNYSGNENAEPSMQMMLRHIAQLTAALDKYADMITAVEVGMFGPWGEMHTSAIATYENIAVATDAFLDGINDVPILVRTPRMIYEYLGITINDIDDYTIDENSKAYRLGIFNDGYLGSNTDLGTFTDREKEIRWLSENTAHLPYGGEVVVPGSNLHDIDKCTAEMFDVHLSYLNIEWNNNVIDKWKSTYYTASCGSDSAFYGKTAFEYIGSRMGYRFVVSDSTFAYSKKTDGVEIRLKIDNVGFGNLTRKKQVTVYLVDASGGVAEIDGGEYGGGALTVGLSVPERGKYKVYVALHTGLNEHTPTYSVRFANPDMWNEQLAANYVGCIEK